MIHRIDRRQIVPAGLEACWAFFSDPANLARLTPATLGFQIRSPLPRTIHPGLMIEYRITPLFGVPLTWLTEIAAVEAPTRFVDEQRVGPYALWHHEHEFREAPDGGVEVRDVVHYRLRFQPLGELAHPLIVAPQLKKIFDYRSTAIAAHFASTQRPA